MALVNLKICARHFLDSLCDQVIRCGVWIATCFVSFRNGRQTGSNGTGCLLRCYTVVFVPAGTARSKGIIHGVQGAVCQGSQ